MQQNIDKALLTKYLEGNCTVDEQRRVTLYLANTEYPEMLDALLEAEWKAFKAPANDNNNELAQQLLAKFNNKINAKD